MNVENGNDTSWLDELAVDSGSLEPTQADTNDTEEEESEEAVETAEEDTEETAEEPTETETEEEPEPEPEEVETKKQPQKEQKSSTKESKANARFAEMRKENSQYKKMFSKISAATGKSVEEVMADITEKALKTQAEAEGMTPEAMAKLQAANDAAFKAQSELKMRDTISKLEAMERDLNLDREEVKSFVEELQNDGFDVVESNVNLQHLYMGRHFDNLVEKRIEEERQKWIAQEDKAGSSATVNKSKGKTYSTQGKIETMDELDKFLDQSVK